MPEVKKKHPGGRPPKPIDYAEVERLAASGNTQEDIAGAFDVDRTNLLDRPEFRHSYKRGMEEGRRSLRSRAFEMAMSGDKTMMIFLLKNLCGMRDVWDIKQEVKSDSNVNVVLDSLSVDELKALVAKGKDAGR